MGLDPKLYYTFNKSSLPTVKTLPDGAHTILKPKNSIPNLISNTLLIVPFHCARALVQYPEHQSINQKPRISKYPEHNQSKPTNIKQEPYVLYSTVR